jgi:hypothetical protein
MATPTDQQKIMRRVFTDSGELIREQLTDKNIPNTRQALLDHWAELDRVQAEADALAAQQQADALAAMDQAPGAGDVMALAGLQDAVSQHADLIAALDQRTAGLEAAVPDETLRLASQIQLAAGAAVAVEAAGLQVQQQVQTVADQAQARLSELDQRQAASVAQVADLVIGVRQQVDLIGSQAIADAKKAVAQLVTTTTARVADMKGPRGAVGAAGAATTVGAGVPQGPDAVMPLLGRGAVIGDIVIDGTDDSRRAYRWTGDSWEPGPAMVSLEVRDVKIASMDASTKVTSLQTISGGGGGGGGGGEHLLVNRIGLGGSTAIGDTSNWAGISDIRSGIASVDLLALDGGNQGKTYAVELPFTWDSSSDQFTADGELGNLLGLYTVSLSVQRSAAVAPAVFTGAMPPGAQRLVTFLTVAPAPGGGGDTTQFRLSGSISYNHVAQGAAVSVQTGGLQPLWIWS